MPETVAYDTWSLWNIHLSAASHVYDLINLKQGIYQADFRKVYVHDIKK